MVARLKLKGIDGRAHQEWSLRLNKLGHDSWVFVLFNGMYRIIFIERQQIEVGN